MKNFKRVISAVIALALSASTLVAVSASKFADVDNTSYAEAIEVLTALDIVHGYEEEGGLVFKPEGDITRAEAATMIVGALNMNADAQAAAGTSKFTDVNEKASWATGYVNVGVAQGFINGMDDTTFAPQENVTYAQMCVMLTLITGYGEYAKSYGGYPTGYTTMAASAGINKGVALSAEAKLKRGQVAQMLYNALTTPLLGVTSYSLAGNEYAPQDGTKAAFKTLLADKFDGYAVDVKIEEVPNGTGTVKAGEVQVSLAKDDYLSYSTDKTKKADYTKKTIADDYGVVDQLFAQGKAILTQDTDDKWHLVYFKAGDAVETISLDAIDYESATDGGKDVNADKKVTFNAKDYKVNTADGKVYVNGVEYGDITEANVSAVLAKANGEVKLIDTDAETAGYEKIMASVYTVAKVAAVSYTNETTKIQIAAKTGTGIGKSANVTSIEITDDAVADDDYAITVKNAAGETVALSSVKKDDIIAFATKFDTPSTGTILKDPETIDILVTDEKIQGKVTVEDPTDKTYTIGGTAYELTVWKAGEYAIGTTYSLALDPFGRIYEKVSTDDSSYRYGIAQAYNTDDELQVILGDGSYKYYEVNVATVDDPNGDFAALDTDTPKDGIQLDELRTYLTANKADPTKRVIAYRVQNATGKINYIQLLNSSESEETYKEKTNKLGTKAISASTGIVNVEEYKKTKQVSDYEKFAASSFVDNTDYKGAIFEDLNDSKTAAFIVLTEVGKDLTENSRFAVVRKKAAGAQTSDGDTCLSLNVLYEGEEQDILCDLNSGVGTLNPGDAIFFKKNAEGLVDSYIKILDIKGFENGNLDAFQGYDKKLKPTDTSNTVYTNPLYNNVSGNAGGCTFKAEDWAFDNNLENPDKKDYQIVYGVVADADSSSVTFARITSTTTPTYTDAINLNDKTKFEEYGLDSSCVSYRYGINDTTNENNQYKSISVSAPQ